MHERHLSRCEISSLLPQPAVKLTLSRGGLGKYTLLKCRYYVMEYPWLFPERKITGSVDHVEMRRRLLVSDSVVKNKSRLTRDRWIMTCPHNLGRNLEAVVAAG